MNAIRSILYAIWLYGSIAVVGVLGAPLVFLSERGAQRVGAAWGEVALFGLRWICGVKVEMRGFERIDPSRPVLIAPKHQAMLDVLVPIARVPGVVFVLKKELLAMPVFGWYCRRIGMISIDRDGHASALKKMIAEAKVRIAEGRSIVIFPEGTRQEIGAPLDYKPGVAAIYGLLGLPCLPMALNTGLVWDAKGIGKRPGTATFELLEEIPPGLKRDVFMETLIERIETASDALLPPERRARPSVAATAAASPVPETAA